MRALVIATIALSLVALTGLSGQVSLAQYLFVGIGAFVTGKVFGGDSVLGMLLGGARRRRPRRRSSPCRPCACAACTSR